MKTLVLILAGTAVCGCVAAQETQVHSTAIHSDAKIALTIAGGRLELPSAGVWFIAASNAAIGPLSEAVLAPPQELLAAAQGDRMRKIEDQKLSEDRMGLIYSIYWACRQYAEQHDGVGPASPSDLDENLIHRGREGILTNYFIVPRVRLPVTPQEQARAAANRVALVFELAPGVDDGKHWVVWNDGQAAREPIQTDLMERYGLKLILPGPNREGQTAGPNQNAAYRIYARLRGAPDQRVKLRLSNHITGEEHVVSWNLAGANPGARDLLTSWAGTRVAEWHALNRSHPTMALSFWLRQAKELYGVDASSWVERQPGRGNTTTIFNVLGGRAAIRETLQMQDIGTRNPRSSEGARVPLGSIEGVTVKSHPYAQMLAGKEGGRLALADAVPSDRFLAYFPRPEALVPMLDSSSVFLHEMSAGFTGRRIEYGLLDRYLQRLGLTEQTMRSLLDAQILAEVALILPDLFLIDGTDVTVVARVRNLPMLAATLRLLGFGDLTGITTRAVADGKESYWTRRDDLLIFGSNRGELDRILDLVARGGRGSLGQSAEFRYMLDQLPPKETTRAYVYFSDPFIRRLTGPAVKIGQLRRVRARSQLEALSAGALLHRLDHPGTTPRVEELFARGYAADLGGLDRASLRLDGQGCASSPDWGVPGGMKTLLENAFEDASQTEAEAYREYRENYSRFWRQFFDPIAIRLDQTEARSMEIETFILPLIDSTIYQDIRQSVADAGSGMKLRFPRIQPQSVAMLSLNLKEEAWVKWLRDLDRMMTQVLGVHSTLLDQLGPSVHLALADGDPILTLGSGDLLSSFGGAGLSRGNEMFALPILVSALTRPCTLLVELKDPEAATRELRRLPTGTIRRDGGFLGFSSALYRVTGRDSWIYAVSLGDVVKLRFGIEVQGRYLVISNLPLTQRPRVERETFAVNNGARLEFSPRAAIQLVPSLHASAMEMQRDAAMEGAAMLYPIVASGFATTESGAAAHGRMFGFAPLHPEGGRFDWDGSAISSTVFGRPGAEQQPPFETGNTDFGIMRRVSDLDLDMQFEHDGLRAVCRWTFEPRK